MLFDANVLLDVLLLRGHAIPAARALTFAETSAVRASAPLPLASSATMKRSAEVDGLETNGVWQPI